MRNASQPFCPGVLGPIGIPATVSIEEMFDRARALGAVKTSMLLVTGPPEIGRRTITIIWR
ncbi:MAG TPA: hypothetical protein VE687_21185, partial [Stellaceae bacterium]|nr:hypothetical protein [Stellaceae bacterium]